ncbi:Carboxylic acid transporter, partial [Spiromyces aspiralis]
VCIGGAWGPANSLAMESLPIETRGIYSGIFHSGYPIGFLLANMFYVAVVPRFGWRALYWFEVIPAVLAFVLVYFVHESNAWKQARKQARENEVSFSKQVSQMLKHHWLLCIYAVLLLSAMSYMAHAAQDLYATFLKMQLGYTPQQATITLVIMNCGAFIGGLLVGYLS